MIHFMHAYNRFLEDIGKGMPMVLSTSLDDKVTSRMMSIVASDGILYFQTDITSRKYRQLIQNPHASLCASNVQIEGVCREIGHPSECPEFSRLYKELYSGSYRRYSHLMNERVFAFSPVYVQRWLYKDAEPYVESYDIDEQQYALIKYVGK